MDLDSIIGRLSFSMHDLIFLCKSGMFEDNYVSVIVQELILLLKSVNHNIWKYLFYVYSMFITD